MGNGKELQPVAPEKKWLKVYSFSGDTSGIRVDKVIKERIRKYPNKPK